MLSKRVITSFFLVAITVLAIIYKWFCPIFAIFLIIGGLYEFFKLIEKQGIYIYKYFGMAVGVIIPLSIAFRFELTKNWELLFFVLMLLFIFLLQFSRREETQAVVSISTTVFGILYVAWLFSFVIKLRFLPFGAGLVAAIVLITKAGDIGAYLIGSRWGKRALIPRISPKKTIEGAISALAFSVLAALASKSFLPEKAVFSNMHLIAMGLFFGILGQLGDLSESLIKRSCQAKDSGGIFPGLGGVLDVIDSLLFTIPAFYVYMSTVLA
ncbi:MAG: phosphatidate cytidylyltransferase [Candidatus Omnitrophica bacterium]|nr:phosphatidate cytidylyltransferase [Candidatus Omnitrophota bacterium]